jgi:hypothetical protein
VLSWSSDHTCCSSIPPAQLCCCHSITPPCLSPLLPRRALEPGQQYLQFWTASKDDIFELVPRLNKQYDSNSTARQELQALAQRGQEFASMYLSPRARFMYWRAAVLAYRKLLPDMDQYAARMVKELKAAGKIQH